MMTPDQAAGAERSEYVDVTPELAAQWLEEANVRNRPLSQTRVDQYAREMAEGRWRATNQGIGFGADGRLYDGQHRLWAVVQSGCTVRMLVVYGLDEAARLGIDVGKPRRTPDVLAMFAGLPHARQATSCANAVHVLVYGGNPALSGDDVLAWHAANADAFGWYVAAATAVPARFRQSLGQSMVAGALVFAHRTNPAAVDAFHRGLVSGKAPDATPMRALARDFLLLEKGQHYGAARRELGLKLLRAVAADIDGQVLRTLQPGEEGLRYFMAAHDAGSLPPRAARAARGTRLDPERAALEARYREAMAGADSPSVAVSRLAAAGMDLADVEAWCVRHAAEFPLLARYSEYMIRKHVRQAVEYRRAGSTRVRK